MTLPRKTVNHTKVQARGAVLRGRGINQSSSGGLGSLLNTGSHRQRNRPFPDTDPNRPTASWRRTRGRPQLPLGLGESRMAYGPVPPDGHQWLQEPANLQKVGGGTPTAAHAGGGGSGERTARRSWGRTGISEE